MVGRERVTKRTPPPARRTQRWRSQASSSATTTCVVRLVRPARSRPANSQFPTCAVSEIRPPFIRVRPSAPSALRTRAASRGAAWRFVDTRSLKHIAKSVNTPIVNSSSRGPVTPVESLIVFWMAARSRGMKRGAMRPSCRARASRGRRGSHASPAARRYRSERLYGCRYQRGRPVHHGDDPADGLRREAPRNEVVHAAVLLDVSLQNRIELGVGRERVLVRLVRAELG